MTETKPIEGITLIVGCNYHTTWQSNKAMRFVLVKVEGGKATLKTRTTGKEFTTNVSDLIFIQTKHNKEKGKRLNINDIQK